MRNTKRELNPYSFYDTEGLARHFERMAAEGWAPDRVGLFIRYRRIKPQKLRFAVAFYPDSDDTPEGEDVFIDYCEQAGWQHAVGAGALTFWGGNVDGEGGSHSGRSRHVFCTADENAVEIDTDPVLQVDATHRGLKPYCHWLVAFSILLITQLDTIADGLRRDPLSGIASGARLVMLGLWMILIVICLSQCIGYYRWYGKAKQIAAKEGRFLRPKSRPWLQTLWRLILLLTIFSAVVVILMGNDTSGQARLYYVTLLIVCGPIAAAFFAYSSMERAGAKRGERCVITALVMVLTVAAVAGLSYTMKQNGLFEDGNANAEWYSENGAHFTIYHDPLLLYLSDLGVEDGERAGLAGAGRSPHPLARSAAAGRRTPFAIQTRMNRDSTTGSQRTCAMWSVMCMPNRCLPPVLPRSLTIRKDTHGRTLSIARSTLSRGARNEHGGSAMKKTGSTGTTGSLRAGRA